MPKTLNVGLPKQPATQLTLLNQVRRYPKAFAA
jgi:hypothetical protein